jgi:hypothetical protein
MQTQLGLSFTGGVHNFGAAPDSVIYVAGTFQSTSTVSSWLWYAWADAQQARYLLYTFAAGVQVVGPPAYNHRTRRLFVPVNNRNQPDRRLIIYELALSNPVVPITASTISVFYEQSYASVSALLSNVPPYIPGFSASTDTGAISMVDEQLWRILVFSSCPVASPGAYCASGPDFSTDYGTAAYKVILEACILFCCCRHPLRIFCTHICAQGALKFASFFCFALILSILCTGPGVCDQVLHGPLICCTSHAIEDVHHVAGGSQQRQGRAVRAMRSVQWRGYHRNGRRGHFRGRLLLQAWKQDRDIPSQGL